MKYVALMRGINVGGKARVEMSRLKQMFEELGLDNVITYINSGNIIFETDIHNSSQLLQDIETAIENTFDFYVPVLLRDKSQITEIIQAIPESWTNNTVMKCDVLFLWDEVEASDILVNFPHNPKIEDVVCVQGAVIWCIDKNKVGHSKLLRLVGTHVYKKITIRNINTVRKIQALMS